MCVYVAGCKLNTHILLLIYCIFASTENWMSIFSSCCHQTHWYVCISFNKFECVYLFWHDIKHFVWKPLFLFAFYFNDDDNIKNAIFGIWYANINSMIFSSWKNPFYLSKIMNDCKKQMCASCSYWTRKKVYYYNQKFYIDD